MRVLFLSQYFPPECGATQSRTWEMARGLVRGGHTVTVVTEVPNHPAGVVRPEFRRSLWRRRTEDGVDVLHLWVATSPVKSRARRLSFYGTYALGATLAGLALRGRYDVLYATSPPLTTGAAALILSRLRGLPLVFEVRDLWPESAVALGELTSPAAVRWATRLEEACYRRARRVVVVTQGIKDALLARNLPPEKVVLIPNGASTTLHHFSAEGRERVRRELGAETAFLVVYAGLFGVAQGLDVVLEAARALGDRPDIRFVLMGEGPEKALLQDRVREFGLTRVRLMAERPCEQIHAVLSAADAVVVPLRDLPVFRGAVPSKIFDAWACRRPVLLAAEGEGAALVREVGGGVCVPPENPNALAEAVLALKDDAAGRAAMGAQGYSYTVANRSRESQADRLRSLLEEVVA